MWWVLVVALCTAAQKEKFSYLMKLYYIIIIAKLKKEYKCNSNYNYVCIYAS